MSTCSETNHSRTICKHVILPLNQDYAEYLETKFHILKVYRVAAKSLRRHICTLNHRIITEIRSSCLVLTAAEYFLINVMFRHGKLSCIEWQVACWLSAIYTSYNEDIH